MRYYYEPFKLKAWVRDNQNLRVNSSDDSAALKPDRLTQLEEDFHLASETEEGIKSWFHQLSRRERNASTHLLQKEWEEPHALPVLRDCLKKQAHEDHRLFKRIVDVTYNTCDVENLWDLVKLSFGVHHQKIQKRMKQENQHRKWYTLLSSPDPVYHLAKTAYESDLTFLEELETFYLTENYPLYKLVMIEAFGMADEDFFLKEKEVYKSYFNTVKSENQQKLAESLIRQCDLDNVEELGRFIYERLKTYMKKPSLWRHVGEEEKKRFSSWIIRKETERLLRGY
ncbi:hypothetical protein [Alkalihalophilus marmarensis]|uniref:hypothetical protein n=1 Tax=Alkalihalophilus marmarensis TaxID=521377 RepID=UPI002DBE5C02|nr:hypothetical protein [Alkalihalophilus marmarensis]MEC2072477.1 hypothetical protein [Alkalihalophilus marmarensis]